MLSVCRMYISDLQFAEDVMSKGFLKVFENINNYTFNGSFEGWIRKIMVNTAIDYCRQKKSLSFSTDNIEIYEKYEMPSINEFDADEIQKFIDLLPEGYKIVFVMFVVEEYSHKEIAKQLKISESTSKSQLFKAKKFLKQKIEAQKKSTHERI